MMTMWTFLKYHISLLLATSFCLCSLCACDRNDEEADDDKTYMSISGDNGEGHSSSSSEDSGSGGNNNGSGSASAPKILTVSAKGTRGATSNTIVVTFTVSGTVLKASVSCRGKSAKAKATGNTYKATITGLPKEYYPSYTVLVSVENTSGTTSRTYTFKMH